MIKEIVMICLSGWLSQYSPGVMNSVIHQQQIYGRLPFKVQNTSFLAVEDCSQMNTHRWIDEIKFLVTDCSGSRQTSEWMWNNNILGEVDYDTALGWGTIGHGIRKDVCRRQLQFPMY